MCRGGGHREKDMVRKCTLVFVSCDMLEAICKRGCHQVTVESDIPATARLVAVQYDVEQGGLLALFEDESFPGTPEGRPFPEGRPLVVRKSTRRE